MKKNVQNARSSPGDGGLDVFLVACDGAVAHHRVRTVFKATIEMNHVHSLSLPSLCRSGGGERFLDQKRHLGSSDAQVQATGPRCTLHGLGHASGTEDDVLTPAGWSDHPDDLLTPVRSVSVEGASVYPRHRPRCRERPQGLD